MHTTHAIFGNLGGVAWAGIGFLLTVAGLAVIVTGFREGRFVGWISAIFGVPMILFGVWIILMVSSGSLPGHGAGR